MATTAATAEPTAKTAAVIQALGTAPPPNIPGVVCCTELEINLSYQSIDADGAAALAAALAAAPEPRRRTLGVLDLHSNCLRAAGAVILARRALVPGVMPHLRSLSLNLNRIGDAGTRAIADALRARLPAPPAVAVATSTARGPA